MEKLLDAQTYVHSGIWTVTKCLSIRQAEYKQITLKNIVLVSQNLYSPTVEF